ncbi:MAG: DUF47 family protein [Crenarchaeota archaeon]|nr:DUF47 family protein [Thermoproteota archaeon]
MILPFKKGASRDADVFDKLANHLSLSIEAANLVEKELAPSVNPHEVERIAAQVIALEKRGDELASEITKLLARSTLPLTMHGELERILDLIDDILDELYFVSQELARGRKHGVSANPRVAELYRDLAAMSSVAKLAIQKLRDLIATAMHDTRKAEELNIEIDAFEDRVDEMRNSVLNRVYESRHDFDAIALFHIIEVARAIDRIVDTCKDVAHMILSIVSGALG